MWFAPALPLPWDAPPHHRHGHLQGHQGRQGVVPHHQRFSVIHTRISERHQGEDNQKTSQYLTYFDISVLLKHKN